MRQWNVETILATSRGFMESRLVLSAVELEVFTVLGGADKSLDEMAAALGAPARGVAILLDALAAVGLLRKADNRYSCPDEIHRLLDAHSPESIVPMIKHNASIWAFWSDMTAIVRRGGAERAPSVFQDPADLEAFIGAMHVVSRNTAGAVARAAGIGGARNLLDIGGATGTYAEAFLREQPAMRATIFDQPSVIEMARKRLAGTDIAARIELVGGDFYNDELPGGHDLALLSAIIHQNSPEQNVVLYAKAFRALVPGGRLLIRDFVLSEDRTRPIGGAMFALNMLVATTGGNCYTFDEMCDTLEQAGFTDAQLIQSADTMDGLVIARKP